MQRKSVPLLIKNADDDPGAFTGLASVFDNLDQEVGQTGITAVMAFIVYAPGKRQV